jgi:GNAT superfamily N-acetyltransferase
VSPPFAVRPVGDGELDALLPLIAGYQRFYGAAAPDDDRNRAFWAHFTAPGGDRGLLLGAYDESGAPVGFATVYWTWDSISAGDVALLYDVFVADHVRGGGVGRALVGAAAAAARQRGHRELTWVTALDNRRAQRLYESLPTQRSAWFEYALPL